MWFYIWPVLKKRIPQARRDPQYRLVGLDTDSRAAFIHRWIM